MSRNATFPVILIIAGAALAWVGYTLGVADLQKWLLAVITFVEFAVAGWASYIIARAEDGRNRVNLRVVTILVMTAALVMNFIFSFFAFTAVAICVPNILLMLILVVSMLNIKY